MQRHDLAFIPRPPLPGADHPVRRLYIRFTLSYRDVEELLAERGLDLSYETIAVGCSNLVRSSRETYGSGGHRFPR
jgi:hypothetical protein